MHVKIAGVWELALPYRNGNTIVPLQVDAYYLAEAIKYGWTSTSIRKLLGHRNS